MQVEGEQLAVFKYGNSFLATAAKCPHVGGPLHLGDIEVYILFETLIKNTYMTLKGGETFVQASGSWLFKFKNSHIL